MAMANYSELQTSIANWLHRSDLTAVIPDFIALAESRINRLFTARGTEIDSTLTATSGSAFIDLPADFGAPIALWLESFVPRQALILKLPVELGYVPIAAYPTYWAIKDGQIQLDRIADAAYPLTLRYVQDVNIAATNTNYILTNYPDIYLFGALIEAASFIRDSAQLPIWQQKFDTAIVEAQTNENSSKNTLLTTENVRHSRFSIIAG